MNAGELLVLFCYRVLQHCHQHDNLCTMQTRAVAQRAEEVSPSLPPTPVISFLRPFTYACYGHCSSSLLSILHTCLVSMPYTMSLSCSLRLLNHTHIPTHPHANTHKRTFTRTYVHTHVHTHRCTYTCTLLYCAHLCLFPEMCSLQMAPELDEAVVTGSTHLGTRGGQGCKEIAPATRLHKPPALHYSTCGIKWYLIILFAMCLRQTLHAHPAPLPLYGPHTHTYIRTHTDAHTHPPGRR